MYLLGAVCTMYPLSVYSCCVVAAYVHALLPRARPRHRHIRPSTSTLIVHLITHYTTSFIITLIPFDNHLYIDHAKIYAQDSIWDSMVSHELLIYRRN